MLSNAASAPSQSDPRPAAPRHLQLPPQRDGQQGGGVKLSRDHLPRSESLLIGCQVLLGSLVSLQSFDGVDVLRKLRLPPHQDFVLLQVFLTLRDRQSGRLIH